MVALLVIALLLWICIGIIRLSLRAMSLLIGLVVIAAVVAQFHA